MASIGQTTRPGYVYDSATDTWIPIGIGPHTHASTDLSGVIANSIVDAKADLITATADNTPARLAVGANGQYLQADSSTATGLKWADVSAGGITLISTTTLSGVNTTITSIPTTYLHLQLIVEGFQPSVNQSYMGIQLGTDTQIHTNYYLMNLDTVGGASSGINVVGGSSRFIPSRSTAPGWSNGANPDSRVIFNLYNYTSGTGSFDMCMESICNYVDGNNTSDRVSRTWATLPRNPNSAFDGPITRIRIDNGLGSGTIQGTAKLYGVK